MRNGRKTRTLLPPPPPGFVVEVVDFRAGFFSTSSSENRFGVGARRALFLSLILLNRVFFVNVRSLVLIIGAASFFLSFVHTNNNSLALYFFCPQCKPSRFCKRRCRSLPLRLLRALECFSRVTQRHRGQETTVCVIRRLKMETFLYPIALDFRLFVPNNRTFSPRFLKP